MCSNLQRNRALRRFLVVFIYLHVCFIVQARGNQGGEEKVTIVVKNVPLRDVFKSITKQTGLYLFYSPEVVNVQDKVTVSAKDQPVEAVLNKVLEDKGLAWIYNGNAITIRTKDKDKEEKKRILPSEDDSTTNPVQLTVSGTITDANGNAIPGATVLVKRNKEGATTDPEGKFSIPNVRKNDRLQVSSIGFETREIQVQGNSMLVKLNVVVNDLDETVVIAYGTTTKRLNVGNVGTVKAKDIATQPVANPLLALQGRVPGLFVTQSSGVPGSGVTVRIQGKNSITKGNDPLYVIDGVPYISQLLPSQNNILGGSGDAIYGANGNPMSFINPADIESIDILKDADATAIYGSRAANGAVLITTKKGKAGKTKVDINAQSGWGKVTRHMDLLNTQQFLELRREALRNDGNPDPSPFDYDINGTWDTTRNTDWQKELIGGTAHYTDAQASVSGGSNNTQFLLGTGFHRETTVFPGDFSDKKGALHFNINHVSNNQKFSLQLSGNYLVDDNRLMQEQLTNEAILLPPNAPVPYNKDGSLNWELMSTGISQTNTWENPYARLYKKFKSNVNNLVGNMLMGYKILPNLEFKSSFGYTNLQQNDFNATPQIAFSPVLWPIRGNAIREAVYIDNSIQSWIVEPQLSYTQNIKKGKLDVLIGSTLSNVNSKGKVLKGVGYDSDEKLEDIRSAISITVNSTIQNVYKYNALFGRLNYNWQDKYIVSFTARRDGSSRFGKENRFHNFGSVAAGWIFSNENYMKSTLPFLSFGKLKGSYGTTGSDQIGDYLYLSQYDPVVGIGVPYLNTTNLSVKRLANPYLQWEETKKLQVGLELGFMQDRIYLSATYFKNSSSNQLLDYVLPSTTGFTSLIMNFPAKVHNLGWELTLNTANWKGKDFSWNTDINLTIPRNKLADFPNLTSSSYADMLVIGKPISIIKLYNLQGVDPKTGAYTFVTKNGQTSEFPDPNIDRTNIVSTLPKYYGGIQNTFRYKGLQLGVLLQFVKQKGSNYFLGIYPGANNFNQPVYVMDRWRNENATGTHQRANADYTYATQFDYANNSNIVYGDASYIRVKNVSLSWQLPIHWYQAAHVDNIRIYAQAQNIFTITGYKGLDPETMSTNSLPPLKVLTLGFQITL